MKSIVLLSVAASSLLIAGSAFAVTPSHIGPNARTTHVHHVAHQRKPAEVAPATEPGTGPTIVPDPEFYDHAVGNDG